MYLLDVNILIATHRLDHPDHEVVRPWFDDLLADRVGFTVPDIVAVGFVRISTNRRVFSVPTPATDAFDFLDRMFAQPNHVVASPGDRRFALFRANCVDDQAAGDLVTDAYIAALAAEHGYIVASLDRDFGRFRRVEWIDPSTSG